MRAYSLLVIAGLAGCSTTHLASGTDGSAGTSGTPPAPDVSRDGAAAGTRRVPAPANVPFPTLPSEPMRSPEMQPDPRPPAGSMETCSTPTTLKGGGRHYPSCESDCYFELYVAPNPAKSDGCSGVLSATLLVRGN